MADSEKIDTSAASGTFGELRAMVTTYAKQETLDPLKRLGLWSGFGVGGALMFAFGGFFACLGFVRLFQTMDWTDGNWSFLPYMFTFLLLMAAAGLCFWAMSKTPDWMDDDA